MPEADRLKAVGVRGGRRKSKEAKTDVKIEDV